MNFGLFGYDFPHIKTSDFIIALEKHHGLSCILAAPWRKLNIRPIKSRTRLKREPPFHPKDIADLLGIPYHSVIHDSEECQELIKKYDLDVGFIGGARILKGKTIKAFKYGIINFHPGLIPENRGLDTLQWAIYLDIPQGITIHFINYRIDAGRIISRQKIPLFKDDTIYDVEQRLYDRQVSMIKSTIDAIKGKTIGDFDLVKTKAKPHIGSIPPEIDKTILGLFEEYLKRWVVRA